jgi:hypothetical protein
MKLWWGTHDYHGIVVAANNLQEAMSYIQKIKYFKYANINPNSIGFINSTETQAYVICNSYPVQHDDFKSDEDEAWDDSYDDYDDNNGTRDDGLEF